MPKLLENNFNLIPEIKKTEKQHVLTVLVEDYFHVRAFENLIREQNWSNFDQRVVQNTEKTLDLLDRFKTKATFFVLGWIAEAHPALIREIVARGHEIGSRGFYHRSYRELTAEEVRDDIRRANIAIENAAGKRVVGFRAAEKLSFAEDFAILQILHEEGFAYDSSFLPTRSAERNRRFAEEIPVEGGAIWEFPYSTMDVGVGLMPISGGNYFRQIPFTIMRHAVRRWTEKCDAPFVLYFHVWELDPDQPRISAATRYNRVRHYRKLDKMEWIIKENLRRYNFTSLADYLGLTQNAVNKKTEIEVIDAPFRTQPEIPVSIVIPCFNEESSLSYLSNALKGVMAQLADKNYDVRLIFVDDQSTDNTFRKLNELFGAWENVKIVRHEKNLGVAAGIMTGISAAETEIVCSMDADCTYDPHELRKMIPLLTEDTDMVTASPYHASGGVRNVPGWRLFLSKGASWLYRRVLTAKISTFTSCFRVYRRSSMIKLKINETGFLGVAEMLGKLDLSGGKIVEFPAMLDVRLFGFSKMKTVRTIFGHLRLLSQMAKIKFSRKSAPIRTNNRQEQLEENAPKLISK